jgi:hypothetical protein
MLIARRDAQKRVPLFFSGVHVKSVLSLSLLVWMLLSRHTSIAATEALLSVASVPFGMGTLEVQYSLRMKQAAWARPDEAAIMDCYHHLLESDYSVLLSDLEDKKDSLLLNDWMFYTLVRSSVDAIFEKQKAFDKELIVWFLMSHAGFDTRLGYNENNAFLYLRSDEEVFGLPMIESRMRSYYHIPFPLRYPVESERVYLLSFEAMPGGRPLSFRWEGMPVLRPVPAEKKIEIRTEDTLYRLSVQYDKAWVNTLAQQPVLSDSEYFNIPVSEILQASLYPQLVRMLEGKTTRKALEILVAFTRSSFDYEDDMKAYGRSIPMTPDEVFHYRYSDCEDRAVLFAGLVHELLQLPVIVIAFPNHITIGVGGEWDCADAVHYAGRKYCICDPTGPPQSTTLGEWPQGYENQSYVVIESRL